MGRKLYAEGQGFNPTTGIDDVEGLREELDALKGGSGGGGGDTTAIERRLSTAEGEIDALQGDVAEQSEEVAAVGAKVNTLQGTDTGKSVRTIAAEETAKIVGGAPDNYNTLKKIADYISSDATGAAELSNQVNKNATDIASLEAAQTSLSATVKTNTNNIATHTQQIANLDSNKLGKTEKAADSAKADSASALSVKTSTIISVNNGALTYHIVPATNVGSLPYGDNANAVITIPSLVGNLKYLHQLGFTGLGVFHRKFYNKEVDTTTPWSQIAFTDSTVANAEKLGGMAAADYIQKSGGTFTGNITAPTFIGALQGNADSATKLATLRSLWGQNFDGSGNVRGDLVLYGEPDDYANGNGNSGILSFGGSTKWRGPYIQATTGNGYGKKSLRFFQYNTAAWATDNSNHFVALEINYSGNVGIGTINPTEKLEVNGNAKIIGQLNVGSYIVSIRSGGDNTIQADNGAAIADMRVTSAGSVRLMRWKDGAGKVIIESDGINTTLRTGNVGIGTTTPTEKLEVVGNIKASGMLTTGSDAHVGGEIVVEEGIRSRGDIDASGNNLLGNLSGTIDRISNTGDNASPIHILGLPTEDNNKPLIDTGVTVEEGVISAEGFKTLGAVEAATLEGNLVGTIKAVMRNTNLFLLGFAQEAGAAAKPYVTTQVSVNNGVLTIKGLRVEGDVEITGNTVIGGRVTSAASYQSSPISTTSEEGVPTTEEQLRSQISSLEERIAALEQIIAQNNG